MLVLHLQVNVNPFRSNVELLSQRSAFEKIEPKEVVEVNEEAKDVEGEGDDDRLVLAGGGGGHVVAVVACFVLRLGVLNMMLCLGH